MDRTRRGGGRVVRGGDACVAPRGGRGNETGATQASPPRIHTTPAPTGTKPPPRRHHKIPTLERLCWRKIQKVQCSRATARDRPYYKRMERLAKHVYSRG